MYYRRAVTPEHRSMTSLHATLAPSGSRALLMIAQSMLMHQCILLLGPALEEMVI